MHRSKTALRSTIAILLLLWTGLVLSIFYIAQRPLVFQVLKGLGSTLGSLALMLVMVVLSAMLGSWLMERLTLETGAAERLILGTGLGLGFLGLVGYGLGAAGLANPFLLIALLTGMLLLMIWSGNWKSFTKNLKELKAGWEADRKALPFWILAAVALTAALTGLFALLPPAEGFDALLYHLTLPERLLADHGILPHNILQFWFPSLIEGDYLWALALGSERAAQLLHFAFMLLTLGVVGAWTRRAFGTPAAAWALAVLISMPSLPWLSSWAYTDMALAFAYCACLYSLLRWSETSQDRWLPVGGIFAGMAMGIKYTSFILPILSIVTILIWAGGLRKSLGAVLRFSIPALLVASPWYLRNWLVMGNPFYPFLFNGLFWDSFQAAWYLGKGTGIGADLGELLLLPFSITIGVHDQNYFDGRIGPLFLWLAPLAIWAIWSKRLAPPLQRRSLFLLALFGAINFGIWISGIIQTNHLWQARLLWPGLIPLAIPIGVALANLTALDLPWLRISFIVKALVALVIAVTMLDNGLSLVFRRPITYALGMESRQAYFERLQPGYAAALDLVASTPQDASVYFLFEPRSYGMPRRVQPDPINDNLLHDFYLYKDAGAIVSKWREQGYTHVLIFIPGKDSRFDEAFQQVLPFLHLQLEKQDYRLYSLIR